MRFPGRLALFVSLTLAAPALAQPPPVEGPADTDSAPVDVARSGGDEGLRLFAAGKVEQAYESFRRAERLYHAPTLVLYMAHCQKRLGRLATARALYLEVVDEHLPRSAPIQFFTAQIVARTEAARLERRVPVLVLEVAGGSPSLVSVSVDNEAVPAARWTGVPIDPGDHIVDVRVGGGPPQRRSVNILEGVTQKLSIALPATPGAVGQPDAPGGAAHLVLAKVPSRGPLTPALVAFGAGVAALGVGIATGVMSLDKATELKELCVNQRCPLSAQPTAASAGQLANAADAAFAVAGAAVAAGIVLAVVRPGGAHPEGPAVGLTLGPRSVLVSGSF